MKQASETLVNYLEELEESHGLKLRDIALTTIRSKLLGMKYRPRIRDSVLKRKAGVFVTLTKNGELRGRTGFIYPTFELWEATRSAASMAAFSDPRFKPITKSELDSLEIEISVIGPLEQVKLSGAKDIESAVNPNHGLMVIGRGSTGLLLPQVLEEMGLSPKEFLEAACEQAGLPCDGWKSKTVSVYRFPARIF